MTVSATSPPPALDADRLARLEAFAERFRDVFPRADQFRRFVAYLAGLLAAPGRKNVEGIAAAAVGLAPAEADLVQALQHFVTRSPWDAARLFAAVRRVRPGAVTDPGSVWVVHDAVFPKKGRHSAGVQRQFARVLGQKVNCQLGVVLAQHGPAGYFPLAARLYLPAPWLRDNAVLAGRTIPEEARKPASKAELALAMIDEVRAEGRLPGSGAVAAEDAYAREFAETLTPRGLSPADEGDRLAAARERFDEVRSVLGLDHFEGRTWAGWHHHVSLVFTAFAFRAGEPGQ
ncbi:transposase [bacterium]|nr:transposase [bacterium]